MADASAEPANSGRRRILLWFRNDLRLLDNVIINEAVQKVQTGEYEVLPVYCYDPRFFAASPWGTTKTGPHRAAFLQQCVAGLRCSLQQLGSGLLVAVGAPEAVLPAALEGCGPGAGLVLCQEEVTSEETAVDAAVQQAIKGRAELVSQWGPSLLHVEDLPYQQGLQDMPDVFTRFKEQVEQDFKVRPEFPAPQPGQLPLPRSLPPQLRQQLTGELPGWQQLPWPAGQAPQQPQPNPKAALQFKGGEGEALARLRHYLWDTDLVATYFDIRNGMLGGDYSTKFAPWMAAGCLSPRTIYHETKVYEAQRVANKSTYWITFELLCRDFFRFYALKQGSRIFHSGGPAGLRLPWSSDPELWQRWAEGRTGMPLVDANMRELQQTGWMSNRGRQNVASYLALDLGCDWRRGGDLFEHLLLDYDPASNWGNWAAAAGLTGGRVNHFNITKQSKDYDPAGDYIRHWIPELKDVPTARIHEPWLMTEEEQQQYGVRMGVDYPLPIPASRFGRPHGGGAVGGDPAGPSKALGQLPALSATRPAAAAPAQLRVRGRSHSIAAMAHGQAGGGARRIVLFFRNDLRVRDNVIVHQAVQKVKAGEYDEVLPVYCYDPRFFAASPWGTTKTGPHRAAFLQQCVAGLRVSLQQLGSGLLVAVGAPEAVLPAALEGCAPGAGLVLCQEEVTSEETAVDAAVQRAIKGKAKLVRHWGPSLYHIDDLPFGEGLATLPNVFTPFREKVEKQCKVRPEFPAPQPGQLPLPRSLPPQLQQQLTGELPGWQQLPWPAGQAPQQPQPNPKAALQFKGGEAEALARLRHYLWDTDLVATYFDIRNGMLGGDYSTKFAPWMAAGCLSPRTVYHELKKYEAQRTANKSTYWVVFELIWRDFFRFYAAKQGNRIFHSGGPVGLRLPWSSDPELWQRWAEGSTGMPLVDANMRELQQTGWMSNRGRQNVASYLALDLGCDWRRGGDLFEHLLLDYDPASNWGNWAAAAGLTGGRVNHFNITKQSKDYDPAGDYIRHWIPELKNVPTARIHEPWLMSKQEQQQYGVQIGVDYPQPIPASRFARPQSDASYRVGGNPGFNGYRQSAAGGRSGGGRGRGGSRSGRSSRPRSEFDRYG
uniref:Photolyase/cryptochrome alpha/beta domain-containing protein n=1 Tax=Tetradesmus obliquus TaxID=3088 RepID=A0A383W805_TETOB|eukprot:jgi/Sobl393_1/3257/SZX73777.1